jgi:hypothetical protein
MSELNALFAKKPDGLLTFLTKYPLDLDAGQFGAVMKGGEKVDKGSKATQVDEVLAGSSRKSSVPLPGGKVDLKNIHDKSVVVYANFLEGASTTRKHLVTTQLQLFNQGGHAVRLYYLPWKENARHTMTISDEADYFMTASMHGCRFEVRDFGNGMLSVSHSNIQPAGSSGPAYDPQALLPKLAERDDAVAPTVLTFGKDVYFADAQRLMPHTKHALIPMGIAPNHVKNADVGGYKANVVGSRATGQWRFYYQLSGLFSVELHGTETVKEKRWLNRFGTKHVQKDKAIAVELDLVLQVREIWPGNATLFTR